MISFLSSLKRLFKKRDEAQWPSVSILTCLYEKSDSDFFLKAAQSVTQQTSSNYEWVVLMQGQGRPALEKALLKTQKLCGDKLRLIREEKNLGIIKGLRRCFEVAQKDYIMVLDGDDLLNLSAVAQVSGTAFGEKLPDMIFSDEDQVSGSKYFAPYQRPGWDPILNLSSSYVWHLLAFRRDIGHSVGVYTDPNSEFCQDWDTVNRFFASQKRIIHHPEILYHWRQHVASSTNTSEVHTGSFSSQINVLSQLLQKKGWQEQFEVVDFPIFRGAREFWLKSKPADMAGVLWVEENTPASRVDALVEKSALLFKELILTGAPPLDGFEEKYREKFEFVKIVPSIDVGQALKTLRSSSILFFSSYVDPSEKYLKEEVHGLFTLHEDVEIVSGYILDVQEIVLGGDEIFSNFSPLFCPSAGGSLADPGYLSIRLKHRTISAPNSRFFAARKDFLIQNLDSWFQSFPTEIEALGYFLGQKTFRLKKRVAFSPLLQAHSSISAQRFRLTQLSPHPLFDPHRSEKTWEHFYDVIKIRL